MKKILLFALPLMVMCFASCNKEEEWTDDSPIIQFKDPKFLNSVLNTIQMDDNGMKIVIDRNGDGQISEKEASLVKKLYIVGVRNIDEIKYFTALTELDCHDIQLTELDLSNNTALTGLSLFDNQFTSLNISNNTALIKLICYNNKFTSLDLSNNTALTILYCDENQLTSLDLSNNISLTGLSCYDNQLTKLDLSNNTALTSLGCGGNPLEKIILYKYHMLSSGSMKEIIDEYGEDIIEYVE